MANRGQREQNKSPSFWTALNISLTGVCSCRTLTDENGEQIADFGSPSIVQGNQLAGIQGEPGIWEDSP